MLMPLTQREGVGRQKNYYIGFAPWSKAETNRTAW